MCREGFEYYRCQTFQDFIKRNNLNENFIRVISLIEESEKELGATIETGTFLSDLQIQNIRKNVFLTIDLLKEEKVKSNPFTESQKVVLSSLAYRINGMVLQLWFNNGHITIPEMAGLFPSLKENSDCSFCIGNLPQSYKVLSEELQDSSELIRRIFQ